VLFHLFNDVLRTEQSEHAAVAGVRQDGPLVPLGNSQQLVAQGVGVDHDREDER